MVIALSLNGGFGSNAGTPVLKQVVYSGGGISVPSTFLASTFRAPYLPFSGTYSTSSFSVNTTTNTFTISSYNGQFLSAEAVVFTTTGVLPAPLQPGVTYYLVEKVGETSFKVSLTADGAPIDITSTGSGTHTLRAKCTDLGINIPVARCLDSSFPTWAKINTANGVYDWTYADEYIDYHYNQRGRRLIVCLNQTPTWAAGANTALDAYSQPGGGQVPTDLTYAATFITALLTRYNAVSAVNPAGNKMIFAIEAWNEPSFNPPNTAASNWCGTMAELAQQTKNVYQATKAVDPTCLVLGPGFTKGHAFTTPGAVTTSPAVSSYLWLKASDGAGGYGKDWIDGCGYHGYNFGAYENEGTSIRAGVGDLNGISVAAGLSNGFPHYMTERGVELERGELTHARAAIIEAACGVKLVCLYAFDFYGIFPRSSANLRAALTLLVEKLCGKTLTYCAINQDDSVTFIANGETHTV